MAGGLRQLPEIEVLRRLGLTLCVTLLVLTVPNAALAKRRPPPIVVSGNNNGVVQTVVTDPGHQGNSITQTVSTGGVQSKCTWEVIYMVARLPLPYPEPGTWYGEFCGGPDYQAVVFVPNRANNTPPVQQTPATLALRQVN